MSRFFIAKEMVKGNTIRISGKEAHHILDVMRLKKSDRVVTFDGSGNEYVGFIKDVNPKVVDVEIVERREALCKDSLKITLIQAIPKKEKMDYIVEKATELGVRSIMPVITGRTIPDWNESKKSSQLDRWRKIAKEASKQCGRADIPDVMTITYFGEAISMTGWDLKMIAALDDEAAQLKNALGGFSGRSIAIAIGPEGDFTAAEIEEARCAGFKLVNLGPRVLRSDTAGLAVLAILNYEFGNTK